MIKAPYNFVPLASEVVFPEWASQISIDRPFEDGISGTINVKYTAKTLIFLGNGKNDKKAPVQNYKAANGKYAIPGSSLRGMLRNVIEIASFGKFNRVSDKTLGIRDLHNRLYTDNFTEKEGGVCETKSKAGWLKRDEQNDKWLLCPVEYHRVEDSDLEKIYKLNLKNRNPEERINKISNRVKVFFCAGPAKEQQHHDGLKLKYSKVEKIGLNKFPGSRIGFTVLTGLCGRKHMDFIFEEENVENYKPVPDTIIKQFDDINTPDSANQQSGNDLRKKLEKYVGLGYPGIPVFYLSKDEQDNELASIGLAQMYKLPYKHTLHDAIRHSSENNFSDDLDFAECIFGKIKDDSKKEDSYKNFSLKGRVQFEDAISNNAVLAEQVDTILSNPKPSYYPTYIEQNSFKKDYQTLMNDDDKDKVKLRGWKRYPVRNKAAPDKVGEKQWKLASSFRPLGVLVEGKVYPGAVFEGKIHFHNLKKEELGALLWAITWGEDTKLSHSVGMGKPFGYGQIKAEITSLTYLNNDSRNNDYNVDSGENRKFWENVFKNYMENKIAGWSKSLQLKELFAMANPENANRPGWNLSYMNLANKEFINARQKNTKEFLAPYSADKQEMHLSGINSCQNRRR